MTGGRKLRWAIASTAALSMALWPIASERAWAQQNIGNAQTVVNDVQGRMGTTPPVVLRAGIDVFQNEVINTGASSASRVIFQDNTDLEIGEGSQVTLDRFVFDPDPSKSAVALSVTKGVIRFTTGSLPKSAYQINTPTATVGVRGTVLTVTVAANGTTSVSVSEGSAVVGGSAGTSATVNAGFSTTVSVGAAPVPPVPASPPPPPSLGLLGPAPQTAAAAGVPGVGISATSTTVAAGAAGTGALTTTAIVTTAVVGGIVGGVAGGLSGSGGGGAVSGPSTTSR